MGRRLRHVASQSLALLALHVAAAVMGGGLLVAAFQLGVLGSLAIMFYRGLAIIAAVSLLIFAAFASTLARWPLAGLRPRDAFAAAILSLSLNLSFLIVVPVTVDRSISIFVLAQMAAHPDETFTPQEMSALFARIYVGDDRQIDRRLREQAISGNLERVGAGYRISARGRLVIETAKIVARLFDSRTGLVAPGGGRQSASN